MLEPSVLAALEDRHDRLDFIVRGSEGWAPVFKKMPDAHAQLITIQNRLERKLRRYFRDLAAKSSNFVNWNEWITMQSAANSVSAAADTKTKPENDFNVSVSLDGWQFKEDATILIGVLYDQIAAGVLTGAQATQELYTGWLGVTQTSEFISKAAVEQAGNLIKGLQQTTRRDIARSIQTSIKLGEDQTATVSRLMDYIEDPARARMIARTEAVRAFNSGIVSYGKASGAQTKKWDTLGGGCSQICATIDKDPIAIDDEFEGDGGSYDYPPAHPNCQCSVVLGYAQVDDKGNIDESTDVDTGGL